MVPDRVSTGNEIPCAGFEKRMRLLTSLFYDFGILETECTVSIDLPLRLKQLSGVTLNVKSPAPISSFAKIHVFRSLADECLIE